MRAQHLTFLLFLAHLTVRPLAAADGDLDPTFSADGKVVVAWNESASVQAVAAAPDGELVVAGRLTPNLWAASRLTRTGGLDASWAIVFEPFDFTPAGAAVTLDIHAAGVDPLGRVVLAGVVRDSLNRFRPAVARLTPGGALDATFSGDGLLMVSATPLGWSVDTVRAAQVGRDGGVVFAGGCSDCPAVGEGVYALRLLPDGQPDPSFSGDGWQAIGLALDSFLPDAVTVTPSGGLLIGGDGDDGPEEWLFVVRLTSAGELDASFNGDGRLYIERPFSPQRLRDLASDPNSGRVVLGLGDASDVSTGGAELIGITASGELDAAFGSGGALDLDLEEGTELFAVDFQSDGRIVAAGEIDAVGAQEGGFFLARTLANGTLDASYDDNGVKRVEFDRTANARDGALALTLSGGRLVAAGSARGSDPVRAFAVLRTTSALVFADGFESGGTGTWGRLN